MSFGGDSLGASGGMADKEVQEFVMIEEQKAQFMMQKTQVKKPTIEVVVGTYEELSLGYRLAADSEFEQVFTDHSHAGCVRAAAISTNGLLATGSSDEMIRLFNLRKNKELGSLNHHEGTITWLEFYSNSHLFSCSADGTIGLWSLHTWECLKTFRGHKGCVNACSFHPSGKLALSVGQDKTLRLWNLVTGRLAYTTNLKIVGDFVKWSMDGTLYMIVQNSKIQIIETEGAVLQREISCGSKIHGLECTKDGRMLAGLEDGNVVAYKISSGEIVFECKTHENRVKAMVLLESEDGSTLITASSDTKIKAWDLKDSELELKAMIETKFRITSMGAWLRKATAPKPQKPASTEMGEEVKKSQPAAKKAKVQVEYESTEPSANDKLAQRLKKKGKKKK